MVIPARRAVQAVFWSGLTAGILDMADALIFFAARGVKPIRILQGIAAALIGARSYKAGWGSALLGLALHFLIAFTAALVYYGAARRLAVLRLHVYAAGLAYGGLVYLFMNRVVLPLAGVRGSASAVVLINGVLAVVLLVGLPIAVIVNRQLRQAGVRFQD